MAAKYSLHKGETVVEHGKTSGDGQSPRRVRTEVEALHALVGPSAPWVVEYHSGEDVPQRFEGSDEAMNVADDLGSLYD